MRLGFDDQVEYEPGRPATSNAELVERAARLGELAGRRIATPERAREILKAGRVSGHPSVERYLRLGHQLDRHVEGTVDAYFGPPELAAEVRAAPPVDPWILVADAESAPERDRGRLAARPGGRAAHVRPCRRRGYAGVSRRGRALLRSSAAPHRRGRLRRRPCAPRPGPAGTGPLAERYQAWLKASFVPREQLERIVGDGHRPGAGVDEPGGGASAGEGVALEIVTDKPWGGFCYYLGDLRSRIELNADLPRSAGEVLHLATCTRPTRGTTPSDPVKDERTRAEAGLPRGVDRARADAPVDHRGGDRGAGGGARVRKRCGRQRSPT